MTLPSPRLGAAPHLSDAQAERLLASVAVTASTFKKYL
jgi:hypothetical protein